MSEPVLTVEQEGPVATVTLNRPDQFNALNRNLVKALNTAVLQLEQDKAVRIVILNGKGRGFCAGADLGSGITGRVSEALEAEYKPLLTGIANSNKIWIAQVHGSAAGIGAAIAMTCDFVTIADNATIYMAFAAIGLIPDGGNTQLLLKGMGYHRALEAIVEGQKIPAQTCLDLGLVNKLFEPDVLEAETRAWAESLSTRAPLAMAAAKRLLRKVDHLRFSEVISTEAQEQDLLAASEDTANAVESFFKKEKPVFSGK